MAYPVDYSVPLGDGTRSRGLAAAGFLLIKAILLIPHLFLLLLFLIVIQIIVWIGYWAIAITGRIPMSVYEFSEVFIAWSGRTSAWFTSTTDAYPTFGTNTDHPAQVHIEPGTMERNRLLAILGVLLIRSLLALPHIFILLWLTLGTIAITWFGYVMIVFTGEIPISVHTYLVRFERWYVRTWSWIAALTDEYPPFTLDA